MIGTGTPASFRSPSEPVTVHKVGGRSAAYGIVATTTASDATVRMFSLADGTERTSRSVGDWDGCSPTWLGPDPVLPTTT